MNILAKAIITVLTVMFFASLGAYTVAFPEFKKNVSLATSAIPENFTELYFENHLQLPKSTTIDNPQTFSFTIHNLENKTMTYPFEIYVQDTNGSRSGIMNNTLTLKHNERKTITETFAMTEPIKRAKVVVLLLNKNQEIHFWIGEDNK